MQEQTRQTIDDALSRVQDVFGNATAERVEKRVADAAGLELYHLNELAHRGAQCLREACARFEYVQPLKASCDTCGKPMVLTDGVTPAVDSPATEKIL